MPASEKLLILAWVAALGSGVDARAASRPASDLAIPPAPLVIPAQSAQAPYLFPMPTPQPAETEVSDPQNSGHPTLQGFICDEAGSGTGSASFVSSLKRLALQLSVADSSSAIVGASLGNVSGMASDEILVDYKGQVNSTFGPYLLLSYNLPNSKQAGRVVPFPEGKSVDGAPEGYARVSITGKDLGLPDGTKIQSLEIIALGENGGGNVTIADVSIDGIKATKLVGTQMSCQYVP